MALDIENTRRLLAAFDFRRLFIEELGWSNPKVTKEISFNVKDKRFIRKPIAELAGAVVFEVYASDGQIPDAKTRHEVSIEVQRLTFEHVLVFVNEQRVQTMWSWIKRIEKRNQFREHHYFKGQTGDAFISKLSGLFVDLSELENNLTITDVARKLRAALDVEKVTKKFFKQYSDQFINFVSQIEGIDNENDRRWYASVVLNRLMFIYFLQKKHFVDHGNVDYLTSKLRQSQAELGEDQFYAQFLKILFFEGFAKPKDQRGHDSNDRARINRLLGEVKYLNGGLFIEHKIEQKYKGKIKIADIGFVQLFALFDSYSWALDDAIGGKDDEINPDVLGYIFEKYINQKAFGAYYTRTEITEYLCEQTVYKLILEAINGPQVSDELLDKAGLGKQKTRRHESISEMLFHLDSATCKRLVMGESAILSNITLLDPACGSGAFLVAAMKTLINVYAAVLGKIEFLGDKQLTDWKESIESEHPSLNYYIKKQIITYNLYGVDIMEEATEIAKLRLFLALVASAQKVDELEPLPNIDFNIMSGNSLVGLMRVDAHNFERHQAQTLFRKSYSELLHSKNVAIGSYKNSNGILDANVHRKAIDDLHAETLPVLDEILLDEFQALNIKYEQAFWDESKKKEGKPVKRPLTLKDIQGLEPFHWGYEFSEIFNKKDGFDAIITNPPWEVFKANAKEFFLGHSELVSKKNMEIKDFEREKAVLLTDKDIRKQWLEYESQFPFLSAYYRGASQFKNQISLINGKKAGTDVNLFKLFTEQCFNLLRPGGYCGIIIPSGIYTDLGAKQLREVLFEHTEVQQLVALSNERFLFEGVDHRFKSCLLSFLKGGKTDSFKATFRINPRESVGKDDLQGFLHDESNFVTLSTAFIKRQSPESLSVMEIREPMDYTIAEKMMKFPALGDKVDRSFQYSLHREFDMTMDNALFHVEAKPNHFPLFEGKMIHQFTAEFAKPRYWVDEKAGRKSILGRTPDTGQTLDYQRYRIAHRAIARSTDIRTMIASVLPKHCFYGNSLNGTKGEFAEDDLLVVVSFLNSFCVDFTLRQSVSANLNMFYVYGLPIPRLSRTDSWYKGILERSAKLVCTTSSFADLWESVMPTKWSEKETAQEDHERNTLLAELDGIIAHVYGLTEAEFVYILKSFPVVPQPQIMKTQNAYRDVERGLIKP